MEITWTDRVFLTWCSGCACGLWYLSRSIETQHLRRHRWRWVVPPQTRFFLRQLRVFSAVTVEGREAEFIDDRTVDIVPAMLRIVRGLSLMSLLAICLWCFSKLV